MASSYTTSYGIEKIGSGEQSGAWGTTTNHNLDLLDRIAAYTSVALSGTTHTLTVREASPGSGTENLQDGMYRVIKFTGALGANNTVTIAPNTTKAYFLIENATTDSGSSGPYSVILSQGSGDNITVGNGKNAVVYCDGAGSGAAVVDAAADLQVSSSLTVGVAAAADTKIVFDGNAQDFYVGLDDSEDDLVIGLGSAVGTTPALSIDEDQVATFGKQVRWKKGGDISSATSLTIDTDGNYFDVTGTTTITSFSSVGIGTVIKLHFDGALTLTHDSSDLVLPGAANITTAAGDEAEFVEYASADWRCTFYTKATGKAVIATTVLVDDTSPQLGGFLDPNDNYIGMQKGGDLTSASPLVIDTDGDYFDVTGTTGFAAMTVTADRHFFLQFDGALTMTHDATALDLPGEADITTAVGDIAECFSTGSNTVQCVAYTRASGAAVVSAVIQVQNAYDATTFSTSSTTYEASGHDDSITVGVGTRVLVTATFGVSYDNAVYGGTIKCVETGGPTDVGGAYGFRSGDEGQHNKGHTLQFVDTSPGTGSKTYELYTKTSDSARVFQINLVQIVLQELK